MFMYFKMFALLKKNIPVSKGRCLHIFLTACLWLFLFHTLQWARHKSLQNGDYTAPQQIQLEIILTSSAHCRFCACLGSRINERATRVGMGFCLVPINAANQRCGGAIDASVYLVIVCDIAICSLSDGDPQWPAGQASRASGKSAGTDKYPQYSSLMPVVKLVRMYAYQWKKLIHIFLRVFPETV